jgi:hypothetical protein
MKWNAYTRLENDFAEKQIFRFLCQHDGGIPLANLVSMVAAVHKYRRYGSLGKNLE